MRLSFFGATLLLAGCGGADPSTLFDDAGNDEGVDASTVDVVANPPDVVTPDVASIPDVTVQETGPADSQILCGPTLRCHAQTETCCDHTVAVSQWECVTDPSQCANTGDIPIACSGHDNCVSQGTPDYICCADTVNNGTACAAATDVSCQATCDPTAAQTQVGCSTTDPCPSATPVCKQSTCTLPGYNICTP